LVSRGFTAKFARIADISIDAGLVEKCVGEFIGPTVWSELFLKNINRA